MILKILIGSSKAFQSDESLKGLNYEISHGTTIAAVPLARVKMKLLEPCPLTHNAHPPDGASVPATIGTADNAGPRTGLRPVLSLWSLELFGLAFVGPTAPDTFFGVGAVQSHGHFAMVWMVAMIAVSFTAPSYRGDGRCLP